MKLVGGVVMLLAWGLVVMSFDAPGTASLRYDLIVAAHLMNAGGYLLIAINNARSRLPFNAPLLLLALLVEVVFFVLGPVVMSAAHAS